MSTRAHGGVELALDRERCSPGEAVCGRVSPRLPVVAVDLVRVESSPTSTLEFTVASVRPAADGAFALTVPAEVPPSVTGKRCTLVWRIRARTSEYPQRSDPRQTLEIACPS
jgi:hypothetical protein